MSELKKVRKWFWVWEHEKEELWLNEMALSGWVLEKVGFGVFWFRPCQGGEYTLRLEMRVKNEDYVNFMNEIGAEYVGRVASWLYFRRRSELGDFRIFSDLDSRIGHLKKIAATLKGVGLANLVLGLVNSIGADNLGWINLLAAMLLMYALGRIHGQLDAMEKEKILTE